MLALSGSGVGGLGDTAAHDYNTCILDGGDPETCAALHPEGAAQQAQREDPWAPQTLGPLVTGAEDAAQWAEQKLGPLIPASSGRARADAVPSRSVGKTIAFVLGGVGLVGLVVFGVHRHRHKQAASAA